MRIRIILLILSVMLLSGCGTTAVEGEKISTYNRSEFVLGTLVSIKLLEGGSEVLLDQSFIRLHEIEGLMSVNVVDSEVSMINEASAVLNVKATLSAMPVGEDVMSVIEAGIFYGDLSEGILDITMGPIINAWQIGTEDAHIPSDSELTQKITLVDYRNIELDKSNHTVKMGPEMMMDLGGIAKGYAADEVEVLLILGGVTKAIINLGGNVKVIGEKAENLPFRIGVQNPFDQRNDYIGILSVADQTIVTSGDYERYFEEDGVRYHHIFDETGYPVMTDVASVTVVSERSMAADALSTILFVYGVEKGLELVRQIDGVECIYVMKTNEVYLSSEAMASIFRLTDDAFQLVE